MIVKGDSDPNAKIWLVGEAPGIQEEKEGKPFIGGAGQVLDRLLKKAGISRSECYIDNVIQERPANNDFGIYYEDSKRSRPKDILLLGHERIKRLLLEFKPNVVVPLGNEPLYSIRGHKGILNWRGSIVDFNGTKVIPTIHPAAIMREPKFDSIVQMDFNRIKEQSAFPQLPRSYNDRFVINPSYEEVIKYLKEILPSKPILTFDIETIPDLEQIMCIGFAWSSEDAICIPFFFGSSNYWSAEEELGIIRCIRDLMSNPNIKFIAQNAQYDMTYIMDKWGARCSLWMDTMIAFHCVYPELKKSLAFMTSIYSMRPYYKEDGGQGKNPNEEWIYNCKDVCVTYEIALEIRKEMEEFNTLKFYEDNPNKLIEPLMLMQSHGILIDVNRRAEIDKDLSSKLEELQSRLDKAVGKPININSPKQIKELLYDDLGLPPIYGWGKKDGKKAKVLSCDEDAITQLQKKTDNPVLGLILEIRGITKLLSTYVRAELESSSRICCSYKITGTETGRLSSTKSIYGRGTNLQNIPREPSIRSMFIADPGKILINADLSQAEARIVAYLAEEERMIRVFENGEDIHKINASIIFNIHTSQVTKSQREMAKARVHGANYKIGPAKAAKLAGTTEAKALEDLNKYKAMYPMLEHWWREVENQVGKTRVLTTPFGRKRLFMDRWGEDLIREAIAYVPQSTVGDLLNLGIIRCWNKMPQGWELLANNHDAILAQVPEETDDMHIVKFFRHYFEIPIEIKGRTLIIPMDIKKGKSWGEMKDIKI